jgi:hypothetical protein
LARFLLCDRLMKALHELDFPQLAVVEAEPREGPGPLVRPPPPVILTLKLTPYFGADLFRFKATAPLWAKGAVRCSWFDSQGPRETALWQHPFGIGELTYLRLMLAKLPERIGPLHQDSGEFEIALTTPTAELRRVRVDVPLETDAAREFDAAWSKLVSPVQRCLNQLGVPPSLMELLRPPGLANRT